MAKATKLTPNPLRLGSAIAVEPNMDGANTKPETFHANWIFIILLILFGVALVATALGMIVLTFTIAFPLSHYSFSRALSVFGWAFGSLSTAFCGRAMWMQAAQMARYAAVIDDRGVDFRFGPKHQRRDIFFAWDQIASIQHKRSPAGKSYCVLGKDKRLVEFTAFTFCRPKKLTDHIAKCANRPIQEMKT